MSLSAAPLSSQERPDLVSVGSGARSAGMGDAITANVEDIYAIGWNPAGLSYLSRPELGWTGRLTFAATSANSEDFVAGFPIYVARGELTALADAAQFIGYAYPLRLMGRTVTVGAAYRRFTDAPRAFRFENGRRIGGGRYIGSSDVTSGSGPRAISPSIGVAVTPRLRVGATANVLMGSMRHAIRSPFPELPYTAYEEDYSGLAIDAGVMFQVTERLRVGALASLPHEQQYRWDNDTVIRNVTREVPLALSLGASLTLDSKSAVSADVRFAPWSESVLTDDADGSPVASTHGVNDAYSVHVGYERDVTNEDRAATRRAGLFWRQMTMNDFLGAPISAAGMSVGQSWTLSRSVVDVAFKYQRSERWTYRQDVERAFTIKNRDISLMFGVRRRYK